MHIWARLWFESGRGRHGPTVLQGCRWRREDGGRGEPLQQPRQRGHTFYIQLSRTWNLRSLVTMDAQEEGIRERWWVSGPALTWLAAVCPQPALCLFGMLKAHSGRW